MKTISMFMQALLAVTCISSGQAAADNAKLNSAVEVDASRQGETHLLKFVVKPNAGLVINEDAPWALELKNTTGVLVKQDKLVKADFDSATPGFKLEATDVKDKPTISFDYKLIAFVCTQDKKQCFRDVHNASFSKAKK